MTPAESTNDAVQLLTASSVRELATRLNVRPTKTLGQNFVIDPGTVRRIVRTAGVGSSDTVLEVGPGLGSLTLGLLETGAHVTAVEIDPVLAGALGETVTTHAPVAVDRLTVIAADAMELTELPTPPVRLVANLPYNVAVPVLLHLLAHLPSLREVLVMVQAEVADRIAAGPGSRTYGVPSAKAAWYASASRAGSIGRSVFWPAPNVDSALVRLVRRDPPLTTATRAEVFACIDAAFSQRRKTLRSALAGWAGSADLAEQALRSAGVDPTLRGERLDVTQFAAVAAARTAGEPKGRSAR
ncbi:16S rRNA (adenine(1518)-N(6)/adenine(1519)-N(6))-dimethyltransferase RsmA [Ruania halotolerans]|uniref:16S rRNA (adenine(1518)-N(6)/adenine(1519)-N(6))- dimethyltransferase RsmA n=1 Tax=Ruania halotolerans TaxID=2897773 RepID=UPI001E580C2D|nr:16S rRNA (adenine(1518)-N(6)/adenine(1519)-N(6))-dimethyltransferase RsmA [Ruania halotolerans]UFU07398.1 16S rRNA (adenine(1518)-N(6)/adenine(1519)-N(6))-dimethyltransferase RsmA [Ruania halotolerans]